jgi:hypothetical protein
MKKGLLYFAFLFLLSNPAHAEAILVVGKLPGTVTTEELRAIYFQNGGRLAVGKIVVPVDQKEGSTARDEFYQRAFGRSKTQMKAYWAQRIFTGKGNPPRSVESAKEVINLVNQPNSDKIGYINESDLVPGLSVLLRLP